MATIYKRGSIWWARWYLPGGKRVSRSTGSAKEREARVLAGEMEAKARRAAVSKDELATRYQAILRRAGEDAQAGRLNNRRAEEILLEIRQVANPEFKVVTLREHLKNWHEAQSKRVDDSTARIYGDMVRRMELALGPRVMDGPIADLTRPQVEKALHKIKDGVGRRALKASTVNMDLRGLRQALTDAVDSDLVAKNVASRVKPLPETDSIERAPFTVAEVQAMIDHKDTGDEWRGLIILASHTALRMGDIKELGSKNLAEGGLVIRPSKTKRFKTQLYVPLSDACLEWIGKRHGDFFPDLKEALTSTLSMAFKKIMKNAKVADRVTLPGGIEAHRSFHSLRHSFTSWLAEADIPAEVRQKITGHTSAGIHAIYTHRDESLKRAIEALPGLKKAG